MKVVTRFAPSPTGFLHIGGARTALFNWLYARHTGGLFLLRIEDTDKVRSTQAAIDAIHDAMDWLGLTPDEPPVYQTQFIESHQHAARELVKLGKAYYCYTSQEELAALRTEAEAQGKVFRFRSPWRDKSAWDGPEDVKPVVRLRAPTEGETVVEDLVQGRVVVPNSELDDLILLRSDGTPTYNLAVVVDDHAMGITHVIRGDDHLTNTFRQKQIFEALGWPVPDYAHIPLIHGADGAKLSKRHGALGVDAYRDMGFLPEAMCNYLLRLGWGHGDAEIISGDEAIAWFDVANVSKGPSRFDIEKLKFLNAHYMRQKTPAELVQLLKAYLPKEFDHSHLGKLHKAIGEVAERAKTLVELADGLHYYFTPFARDEKSQKILAEGGAAIVTEITPALEAINEWQAERIEAIVKQFAEEKGVGLGKIGQPLRAGLGAFIPNSLYVVMETLGKAETLARLQVA